MKREERAVTFEYKNGTLSMTSAVDKENTYTYGFRCDGPTGYGEADFTNCKNTLKNQEVSGTHSGILRNYYSIDAASSNYALNCNNL